MRIGINDIKRRPEYYNSEAAYLKNKDYFDGEINGLLDRGLQRIPKEEREDYRITNYHKLVSAIQSKTFDPNGRNYSNKN